MSKEIDNRIIDVSLHYDDFVNGAKKVLKTIDELEKAFNLSGAAKGLEKLSSSISTFTVTCTNGLQKATQQVNTFTGNVVTSLAGVTDAVSRTSSVILGEIGDACDAATSRFQNALNNVSEMTVSMSSTIESATSGAAESVNNKTQTVVGAMVAGIGAKIASIAKTVAIVGTVFAAIAVAVVLAARKISSTIDTMANGVHMTITEKINAIKSAVTGGLGELWSIITDKTSSISDKIRDVAAFVVWNVGKALVAIGDAVRPFIDQILNAVEKAFPQTTALLQEGFMAVAGKVKEAMLAIYTAITTSFNSAINAVREKFQSIQEAVRSFAEKLSGHFKKSKQEALDLSSGVGTLAQGMTDAGDAADELGQKLDGVFSKMKSDAAEGAEATEQVAEAEKDAAEGAEDLAAKAHTAYMDASKGAADAAESTTEVGDSADEAAGKMDGLGAESKEAMDDTKDGAEEASGGMQRFLNVLNKFTYGLGHDLGELPFKLKEIKKESPLVGTALSFAFSEAGKKVADYIQNLKQAKDAADQQKNSMGAIGTAAEFVGGKFTALSAIAFGALERIGQKALDTGTRLIKSLTVDNISQGWEEYGLKLNSTQTIMASTGQSLETVNGYLEELNKYADKTIYSFSDMTTNIGKFTNAGVDLDTAVKAIKGISNEAALSGANAQEASRAMYNFAQAISAGSVKLIDWKSIENANMATKGFKEQLIQTAVELGTVKKKGDQYISVTKDANGHTADAFTATKNFNNSLSAQWMTTEVLMKTLSKYSDETTDFGKKAFAAAQDIKTGKQLMDTLKEAVGSGWSRTFELIVGDLNDAKKFWTGISNLISPIIDKISGARNSLLQGWNALGGRERILQAFKGTFENFVSVIKAAKEGLEVFLPPITAERITAITDKIASFTSKLRLNEEQLTKVKDIFKTFGEGVSIVKNAFKEIGDRISSVFGKDISTDWLTRLIGFVGQLADKVREFAQSKFAVTIHDNIQKIGSVIENVRDLALTVWEQVKGIISSASGVLSAAGSTFSSKFGNILTLIQGAITFIKGVVEAVGSFIQNKLGKMRDWLPKLLEVAMNVFGAVGEILKKLGKFISDHSDSIGKLIAAFVTTRAVVNLVKNSWLNWASAGIKVVSTIGNIKNGLDFIAEKGPNIIKLFGKFGGKSGLAGLASGFAGMVGPALAVAGAIAAVAAAVGILWAVSKKYEDRLYEEVKATYGLSDAVKDFNKNLSKTAEERANQEEARKESVKSTEEEFDYYEKVYSELQTLVDEDGRVADEHKSKVKNMLDVLNDAFGTEMELVDGVITGYKNESAELDKLITKKRISALMDANQEAYKTAYVNENTDKQNYQLAKYNYENALAELAEAEKEEYAIYTKYANMGVDAYWYKDYTEAANRVKVLKESIEGTKDQEGLETAYKNAEKIYLQDQKVLGLYDSLTEALDLSSSDKAFDKSKVDKILFDVKNNIQKAESSTKSELEEQVKSFQDYYDAVQKATDAGLSGYSKEDLDNAKRKLNAAKEELKKWESINGVDKSVPEERQPEKHNEAVKQADIQETARQDAENKKRISNKEQALAKEEALRAKELDNLGRHGEAKVERQANVHKEILAQEAKVVEEEQALEAKLLSNDIAEKSRAAGEARAEKEAPKVTDAFAKALKNHDKSIALVESWGRHGEAKAEKEAPKVSNAYTGKIKETMSSKKGEVADSSEEVNEYVIIGGERVPLENNGRLRALLYAKGIIRGCNEMHDSVAAAAGKLASLLPSQTSITLQERSPSKLSEKLTSFWGKGMVNGLHRMMGAVRAESSALSETLVNSGQTPLSAIADIMNGDFTQSMTMTPVIDISGASNSAAAVQGMLSNVANMKLDGFDIRGIMPDTTVEERNQNHVLNELRGLRDDMARFNEKLSRLQVRMDTGTLVGELADPMDTELGRRAAIGQRG